MTLSRVSVLSSLVLCLTLSGCKVPEKMLQAEGKLSTKDCLAEGASPETLPASAFVGTSVKLGLLDKTVVRVKLASEGVLSRADIEAAARGTGAYRYATESDTQVEGKVIETFTVTEKFKQAKGVERCKAPVVQAVELRTECPSDVSSDQPCSSKLEVSTYSAADPAEAREPLAVFATKRVKHARGQNPFSVASVPAAQE